MHSRFQSTLPRRSDTSVPSPPPALVYFNPRSREGATVAASAQTYTPGISIHAPAKERPHRVPFPIVSDHFNPRSREGATFMLLNIFAKKRISIHAPAKERLFRILYVFFFSNFNPRSREGATVKIFIAFIFCCYFNPRSREGATLYISSHKR